MRISDWSSDVCSSDLAWLFLDHKKPGEYHALANWYSFTFSPIFSANSEERTRLALLRAIARRLRGRATHMSLRAAEDRANELQLVNATAIAGIGITHVRTPVTNEQSICLYRLDKIKNDQS